VTCIMISAYRKNGVNVQSRALLDLKKRRYLLQCWSNKSLKGTVVNRTCPSLNGDLLEITMTPMMFLRFLFVIYEKDKFRIKVLCCSS